MALTVIAIGLTQQATAASWSLRGVGAPRVIPPP
jgi:hypothetical protein